MFMHDFLLTFTQGILQTSFTEWLAFATSLIYVWLASRQNNWCWLFALVSSSLYVYLCYQAQLYADTLLQLFYVLVAALGWIKWNKKEEKLKIQHWSIKKNVFFILICSLSAIVLGILLDRFTNQAFPYIDAAIFCFSLFASYLITVKVLENWIYFIVIDLCAIPLFANRELYLTSILYLAYTIIAIEGFRKWNQSFKEQLK